MNNMMADMQQSKWRFGCPEVRMRMIRIRMNRKTLEAHILSEFRSTVKVELLSFDNTNHMAWLMRVET